MEWILKINILYEDQQIIVCEKPSGIASQSDNTMQDDMVNLLKNYVFGKGQGGEVPYIGIVHRLDRPVGGVMVFAKTPFSAKELSRQIQDKCMEKKYLAVVSQDLSSELLCEPKSLEDYLVKNGRTNLSSVTDSKNRNGKKAVLSYRILETVQNGPVLNGTAVPVSVAEIELMTGRHHQIRVQMSAHNMGIWGDTKYNSLFQKEKGWFQIGLFAYSLRFDHPKSKKRMEFRLIPETEPFCLFGSLHSFK